jgi:hypothetical protein
VKQANTSGCTTVIMENAIAYFKPPVENPETQDPAELIVVTQ